MSENGLSRGGSDRRSDEAPLLFHPSSSGRLELHRRCFSCCNVVLRQEASLANGQRRAVLLEQPAFTEHADMKVIRARVSDQKYSDVMNFVDDITALVNKCVAACDRDAVLGALMAHVAKTDHPDHRRPAKNTFHGFPHPLLEEMLAQTAAARKKMPPNRAHVTVDIGRYLARAYGLGLTSGAQFIGQPSKEKAFHVQRKEREVEWANVVAAETAAAGAKAQKRNKPKDRGVEGPRKKQKLQPPISNAAVTPKPTRSLRGTRRIVSEDSADDELPRSGTTTTAVSARKSKDPRASDTAGCKSKSTTAVPRRVLNREKIQCYHLQGKQVEMYDEEKEPVNGYGFRGTIQGTAVVCHCGCETTMKGVHWLIHNGGRSNNRHPGYPWKYMKLVKGEKLEDHWPCDCHQHLCDSCHFWEEPGVPMTSCWKCHTSMHAAEACATRLSEKGTGGTPKNTTSRRVRRKTPVRGKVDAADGGSSSDSSSVDERDAGDPNAGEWVCQVCSGDRSERERYSYNRWKKRQ